MHRGHVFLLGFLLVALGAPSRLPAQAIGEILGTVQDPGGAVVPGAKITAVQIETKLTRLTATSSEGTYSLRQLPIGRYTVSAEAAGFKTGVSPELTLDVNQQREVNFLLVVAGSATAVEVSAAPPLLTTTNATLGGFVSGQQVTTLPLNGRNVTNLMLLQPGVARAVSGVVNFRWIVHNNGNREYTGNSYMDGIGTTEDERGGASFGNLNLDAIAEFRLLQNSYSAEYGRGAGSIIHIATRSGSNEFHGSLFEFLRNDALDSRNFFSKAVPKLRRNEFGGTVGGPILRDRAFFFFQYAGFRERVGSPTLVPFPTPQERQGIVNIPGTNDQWMVPLVADAQTVLNRYPFPNRPGGAFGDRTFETTFGVPLDSDQWSARIDHHLSDKTSIFGRFTLVDNAEPILHKINYLEDPTFTSRRVNDQKNFGLSYTRIITPTFLNTFRFGFQRTLPSVFPAEGGIESWAKNTQHNFTDGSLAVWGPSISAFRLLPNTWSYNDTVNWTRGRHSANTGLEFRQVQANHFPFALQTGLYTFDPGVPLPVDIPSASGTRDLAAGSPSPSSLISFMVGTPSTYSGFITSPGFGPAAGGAMPFSMRRYHLNAWFQDDIRLNSKLTLNVGVRYEYNSVPYEVAGRLAAVVLDPNFGGGNLYGRVVLNPRPLHHADYRGWGPRFGFAYKLAGKTVFRGGYGIFANLPHTQIADQQGFAFPFTVGSSVIPNPAYSLAPQPVPPLPQLTDLAGNPLPPGGDTKRIAPNTPVDLGPWTSRFGRLGDFYTIQTFKNGYTMAGNVTLEHEFPGEILLQAAYVTNNAVGVYGSWWPNGRSGALPQFQPFSVTEPGLGPFQVTDNHSHSTYHALQTMVRKASPRNGLQFQASYTYSKAIDDAVTLWQTQNDLTCWACEKGPANFDFTHRLVVNFIYAIPLDRAASGLPRRLTQGWHITSILQSQSGFPFTVRSPFRTAMGSTFTRPDLIRQPTLFTGGTREEQFFSDEVIADGKTLGQQFFATPGFETGRQTRPGNLGRNTFRGNPFSNVDFSLIKDTRVAERVTIQFRAEFFNFFNLHYFGAPNASLSSSGFGVSSGTVFPERQIQFALRLMF